MALEQMSHDNPACSASPASASDGVGRLQVPSLASVWEILSKPYVPDRVRSEVAAIGHRQRSGVLQWEDFEALVAANLAERGGNSVWSLLGLWARLPVEEFAKRAGAAKHVLDTIAQAFPLGLHLPTVATPADGARWAKAVHVWALKKHSSVLGSDIAQTAAAIGSLLGEPMCWSALTSELARRLANERADMSARQRILSWGMLINNVLDHCLAQRAAKSQGEAKLMEGHLEPGECA